MPSSVSRSISSSGALVMTPRLVPSAYVIGTSTPTQRMARTVRRGAVAIIGQLAEFDVTARREFGLLPPPLWGRAGEGGSCWCANCLNKRDPHP